MLLWTVPLWGCAGGEVKVRASAPEVEIVAPEDGDTFYADTPMRFEARIADGDTPIEALTVKWTSSVNGRLYGEAAIEGDVSILDWPGGISAGDQEIDVEVIDPEGNTGEDTIVIEVDENKAPTGRFLQPSFSGVLDEDGLLTIEVEVEDRESLAEALSLGWAGTLDLGETPDHPGREGIARFTVAAEPGSYDLTLAITDEAHNTTVIDKSFSVYTSDYDGDGHASTSYGGDDCDDYDAQDYPGAEEVCDYGDNDCDGEIDEAGAAGERWLYPDQDYDGFGAGEAILACFGGAEQAGDCDDIDYYVNPGAAEVCDGADDDCDGLVDADDPGVALLTWYADGDGDGFGAGLPVAEGCEGPAGSASAGTDCDDADGAAYPGAPELCDGLSNDCNYASYWSESWEAGRATWTEAGGAAADVTASLSGWSGSPALLSLTSSGSLRICSGTWYARIAVQAAEVEIVGAGSGLTILDADGEPDGLRLLLAGAQVWVSGLSLTGGAGCMPGISNGEGSCAAPTWYPGVGLWLEDVQVYANDGDGYSGVVLQGEPGAPVTWGMVDSALYDNGVVAGAWLGAGALQCEGQAGVSAGFWGQPEGVRLGAGASLASVGCDWLGAADNGVDVAFEDGSGASGYGDDADFSCDGDLRACGP